MKRFVIWWAMPTLLVGCQPGLNRQPRVSRPDSVSAFFADGQSNRPLEPGTIPRGQYDDDSARFSGKSQGQYINNFPIEVNEQSLNRGRERFNIFCAQCHDRTGTGNGKVVARGYIRPPSYQTDDSRGFKLRGQKVKLTDVPLGYFFDVITNGYGAMPSHADLVPLDDRWAIVAYIKALQLTEAASGE